MRSAGSPHPNHPRLRLGVVVEIERDGLKYVKCEECPAFATIQNAGKLRWDWFTGFLPRTHHWCGKHTGSRMYKATLNASRTKATMEQSK